MLNSEDFPNIRFHYIDVREIIQANEIRRLYYGIFDMVDNIYNTRRFTTDQLVQIYDGLSLVASNVLSFYKIVTGKETVDFKGKKSAIPKNIEELSKYTKEDYLKLTKNIINKIKNRYDNKIVKSKLNDIINKTVAVNFVEFFEEVKQFQQKLDGYIKITKTYSPNHKNLDNPNGIYGMNPTIASEIIFNIQNTTDIIFQTFTQMYARVIDIYFLRRFLDKKYITNVTYYSGGAHSAFITYLLIKHFDFKITHIADPDGKSIDELNKLIKNANNFSDIEILMFPEYLIQCSNLKGFPPLFE
jgi:hypothetical protein